MKITLWSKIFKTLIYIEDESSVRLAIALLSSRCDIRYWGTSSSDCWRSSVELGLFPKFLKGRTNYYPVGYSYGDPNQKLKECYYTYKQQRDELNNME